MRKNSWLLAVSLVLATGILMISLVSACSTTPAPTTPGTTSPKPAATTSPVPTPTATPATVIKWRGTSSIAGITHPFNGVMKEMLQEIKQRTAGRLDVTWYGDGELMYNSVDYLKVVRDGSVEMADIVGGRVAGDAPILNIDGLPFLAATLDDFRIYSQVLRPYWEQSLQKFNQTGILYIWYPAQQIFTTSAAEARKVEDLKGVKIRTWSPPLTDMMKLMGGVPVSLTGAEVPTALQYGTVQGVVTSWFQIVGGNWYQSLKYGLEADISSSLNINVINNNAWNKLPKDIQDIFKEVASKYEKEVFPTRLTTLEKEARTKAIASGMIATAVPDAKRAELAKLTRPIWEAWAKSAGGTAPEALAATIKALGK